MTDIPKPEGMPEGAQSQPLKLPPKQNPVFRMMGMPNFRLRLPSRNWRIFLTIAGGFTAAVVYDQREKKKVQKKWCDLVAHIAQEPLPVNQMPRKLTVFISAPPGDGIRPSREYFKEYIKPVLVAAAIDYDVIEGRKEGDVRYGTAEQIRRLRRKQGEKGPEPKEQDMDSAAAIDLIRDKMHIVPEPGVGGDLVLGRHTWKEYIRGLHEGWLGPVEEPLPTPGPEKESSPAQPPTETQTDDPATTPENTGPEKKGEEQKEKKPHFPPPAYLSTDQYASAEVPPSIPWMFDPSQPIHQQHLLGFLKTPQRIWNFLNRRYLADQIGRETAAIVLAESRQYDKRTWFPVTNMAGEVDPFVTRKPNKSDAHCLWEQQLVLAPEERTWHKSVRKPRKEDDTSERIWMSDIVMDERIGERMKRFQLDMAEEDRARRIELGREKTRARPIRDLRAEKVVLGDVDDNSG
ncbi:uncharacterized protein Z518_05870 [Rhinocladiella mackenziei CBS 650.93]|uniref:Mitochondrial import inner membrane translocase subunit TIM54 n=1 Tax=Rhinocladiella mackenziei CBS 650.93 TaxID=1442369 RepID=A0A0D2H3M3_9EURO|nr:uncharacterized protein Z518_05870 [Rhinocladiella mackenziei CBS 650.93]KIX04998.1 hypothetical protein Z518_05870 [Rhinocladiella mackenziei CBS 650.93]